MAAGISRRGLLTGGAAVAGGAAMTVLATAAARDAGPAGGVATAGQSVPAASRTSGGSGTSGPSGGSGASGPSGASGASDVSASAVEPFHGPHQAGVATTPQAHAVFVAFDLRPGTGKEAVVRLMRLLTDDARRLTQGRPALADTEPELAVAPARLTVTFGFGPGLFAAAKTKSPLAPLPSFTTDKLDKRWSGGDLLVQICADDPITVAHALRMIVKDARSFTRVRWSQRGFRRSAHAQAPGATQRNLMGQLDGTVNPTDLDRAVWITDGPEGLRGGTTLVLRRIRMNLETWDAADRVAREFTIGRRLDTGAPLTGRAEHDEPDFARLNRLGFPVISEYAHIRRARTEDPGLRILRRPYNYDEGVTEAGTSDSGLIFASYQADIGRQFVPVQRRLSEGDLLNEWVTTIGSAVFAVPPGCGPDGWIGDRLL
ncbi:Dyp-type peroxidase [Nonomuraea cavernae]|uniref:Peroxidase n=1 Tax=Nonomuraea cavernae TaxID=2045107 RepID=A0A917YQ87_9ACTN|nr:Dyp-type peroxidase [Nonomuraea cavernae]MCA2184179.1 Dyp-type peroxidase [Nonomuraea cavernae]GGO62548.1 peroxidase [Nonomuraea cavernae]